MNRLIAIAVALLTTSAAGVTAEVYPARPITVVVPYPAGGPTDTLARILADHMKTSLGQSIIIENVTGGGGSIGVGRVARAAPDGYTVSIGHWNTHVVHGATLNLSFHILNDFEPVALLADTPNGWWRQRRCRPMISRSRLRGSSKIRERPWPERWELAGPRTSRAPTSRT